MNLCRDEGKDGASAGRRPNQWSTEAFSITHPCLDERYLSYTKQSERAKEQRLVSKQFKRIAARGAVTYRGPRIRQPYKRIRLLLERRLQTSRARDVNFSLVQDTTRLQSFFCINYKRSQRRYFRPSEDTITERDRGRYCSHPNITVNNRPEIEPILNVCPLSGTSRVLDASSAQVSNAPGREHPPQYCSAPQRTERSFSLEFNKTFTR
ncbi:hypothetical protein F1559_002236 [Cyanidiococcus yangmingshanensis]|uniref:Uncharacterized protein n=1 Tax=Cyanidiococcus yangmingshanensis TaxID=2690220 RepID=A0A7J7IIT3_9RHOD|nr:hypothetical protein F1559_002236 [Cyanidiococcus yangmingshanensis]